VEFSLTLSDVPEAEPLSDLLGVMTLTTRNPSQRLAILAHTPANLIRKNGLALVKHSLRRQHPLIKATPQQVRR